MVVSIMKCLYVIDKNEFTYGENKYIFLAPEALLHCISTPFLALPLYFSLVTFSSAFSTLSVAIIMSYQTFSQKSPRAPSTVTHP